MGYRLNIFFDVDGTILGEDGTLRPYTRHVFEHLIGAGHRIYIWSGIGIRTADIHGVGLHDLVSGIYVKPLFEFVATLKRYQIPVVPDFVIDDHPRIVEHFGGMLVKRYELADDSDTELLAVPGLVARLARAQAAANRRQDV